MKVLRRTLYLIVLFIILFQLKAKAQRAKWLTIYNNKFVNKELFEKDQIFGKDYNNGEGLILYFRGSSDTLMYDQNIKEYHGFASYIKWENFEKFPKYHNSNVIFDRGIPTKSWTNFFPDHASHFSHASHLSSAK